MNPLLIRRREMMEQGEPYYGTLIHHWSGEDAPSSSIWLDKIGNLNWTLTNGVHDTDNYYFANSNPNVNTSYAKSSAVPLMDGFVIVMDCSILIRSSQNFYYPMDCSLVGTPPSNKQGCCVRYRRDTKKWDLFYKLNGNTETHLGSLVDSNVSDSWIRRTIKFGVLKKDGSYEGILAIAGLGEMRYPNLAYQNNPWWENWYLARAKLNSTSTYNYSITCRYYDIKVYDGNI